jgi:hypothetical protein
MSYVYTISPVKPLLDKPQQKFNTAILGLNIFNTYGGDSVPYYLFMIIWATLSLTLLTIGSGIIYALLAGEPKPGPSGPATMAAAM